MRKDGQRNTQTDRHDKAISRFSQCCGLDEKTKQEMESTVSVPYRAVGRKELFQTNSDVGVIYSPTDAVESCLTYLLTYSMMQSPS